jgi:tetratricopeptide (TPR) repeat protein
MKNYENALADFTEAIDENKDFAEAYFNRAITYTKLLDMKKACIDIKKSAQLGYTPSNMHIKSICN